MLFNESARWGNMSTSILSDTQNVIGIPYTKTNPTLAPSAISGDWDSATRYIRKTWLPARQSYYLTQMQAIGLYTP